MELTKINGSYYAPYRKPLKKGDRIGGEIVVRVE